MPNKDFFVNFDTPFDQITTQVCNLLPHFVVYAWGLAKIIILLAIGFAAIKHAINGDGLKDSVSKLAIAFIVLEILIGGDPYRTNYSKLINGMQRLVATMAKSSVYDSKRMQALVEKKQGEIKKLTEETRSISEDTLEIINTTVKNPFSIVANPFKAIQFQANAFKILSNVNAIKKADAFGVSVLDANMFDSTGSVILPSKFIKIISVTAGEVFEHESAWYDLPRKVVNLLAGLSIILCGTLGGLQYFICILEFGLITSVGVFLLPCMLWDGTKFMAEKLFGALLGFFLKMLFCTITLLLMIYGFLGILNPDVPYDNTFGYAITVIFSSIFYMMLCQSGPQLAVSLLTGTPQMSLMEGAKAVGAFAGAGVLAAKGAQKVGHAGASVGFSALSAGVKAAAAGSVGGAGAALKSLAGSASGGMKNMVGNVGRNLLAGGGTKGSGGGGGGSYGYNAADTKAGFMHANADGTQKSLRSTLSAQQAAGAKIGEAYKAKSDTRKAEAGERSSQKAFSSAYNKSGGIKGDSDQNKSYDF
ncbi:MAG: hypothetical protein Ta2B_05580 [Termitinemataceae bacterium]|nr:MAG: hypothetical protein Ta2B_05580 [Termitinemataceae bacterium]